MTPKVEHWRYPFTSVHKHPLDHLAAMGKAKSGYYPIGASGIWHGGVHFDSGTAAVFEQDAVQCIANGEVVAYRIDSRYPKTAYPPKLASFSTGFVLVRHRLEVPPPKFSTVSGPSLTFFSLYMHLRDWAGYDADSASERPAFWEGVTEYEVTTESSGLSVRAQPRAEATKLAELPKGTVVTVGAVEGDFRELLALVSGTPSESLTPSADSPRLGWVASRFLSPHGKPTPHNKDAVVVLPQPVRINAGDLIGHVGVYQQPIQDQPEPVLHLEIFSCEDVPAFMAQCRLTGFRLADEHMTLLKVRKGNKLIPHKESFNASNPPDRFAPDAVKIGADFMLPQSYLDHLPSTHKFTTTLPPIGQYARPIEIHWWRLENLLPDEQGNPISGWFYEQDLITTRHSPWEWENFECIRETGTAVEQHAYAFNAKGLLTADEQQNFRAQINKADEGPIVAFTRLHKMIDTDGDNVLSSNEIQAALGKPWQAQMLAQLVTHYESEWFWSSKWDEMDNLMGHTPVKSNPNWVASKGRIQKLSWWVDLTSVDGIAPDGKAWHFHPIGMASRFISTISPLNKLVRRVGDIISHGEGSYESYNTGTKNVPGGRVGFSFLRPPKGTVTGKTINEILATDELSGQDRNRFFATGKYQTILSTLRTAKSALRLTGSELYDEELQERVFRDYLLDKAGGGALGRFIKKGTGTIYDAQLAAAKEWASIAAPLGQKISDRRTSDGTLSYYESNSNRANQVSTADLIEILREVENSR
jgi:hypothetical protein